MKSEARNPKTESSPKAEARSAASGNPLIARAGFGLRISDFGLLSDFGLRISAFTS
jgi:hypothetical protein